MNKTKILRSKPVYLGQAILDISKTLMYQFWYDYLKPKYGDKLKLCYMDTDSFIIHVETEYFYKDIANDVYKWFDTSGYNQNDNRLLPIGKNKKVIGKYKGELNGKIMIELCFPMAKIYAFITDNDTEIKRAKGTKKCVIKHMLTFENYKESVLKNKTILRSQLRFKSDGHNVYTEEINKIAIRNNDDKKLQTLDGISTYQNGTPAVTVCESEMLAKIKGVPIAMYY